ncbi:MAG TPA: signal peptide peptidase SppA [Spirochaetota bacterium]|nr:signal peptide peptidase SppA [Spirochaetota bacterium]
MERQRKIMVAILALLAIIAVIAVVDIGLKIEKKTKSDIKMSLPEFGPGVGIVRVEGAIEMSGTGSPFGVPRGAEAVIKRLSEIERDSSIKAVVLRINSPGGTVAATQEIYEKLWKLRKKNIILVASMGDVAASGGYYIASACNFIVANYGTITGSIGVIAYSPNLKRLFDKFGIQMNVIKSGKYKDILATHRDMTPEERSLLQEMIDLSYNKFIRDIALGRNMNQEDIRPIADGRVMNGETALKNKLIDQLGTFEDAILKAKELAALDADAPVYEQNDSPFQEILGSIKNIFQGEMGLGSELFHNTDKIEYRYMQ